MSDLVNDAVKLGPAYVSDLISLVQQPKQFVARRVSADPAPIKDALIFLAISFALSWIIKISFLRSEPWLELLPDAAFVLLEVLAYGAAVSLAWRAVKGRAELQKIFVVHFYYSGVFLMLMGVWFMVLMGIMRAADPGLYADMWEAVYDGSMLTFVQERVDQISESPVAVPMASAMLFGLMALIAWVFVGWGAYRELNHLSRARSATAATIFVALSVPISAMLFFIANAATNTGARP